MTDVQIIRYIRLTPSLNKAWNKLEPHERRKVIEIADSDTWHLDSIMEFLLEEREVAYA